MEFSPFRVSTNMYQPIFSRTSSELLWTHFYLVLLSFLARPFMLDLQSAIVEADVWISFGHLAGLGLAIDDCGLGLAFNDSRTNDRGTHGTSS